jgi:glutaredoxin-dependent peroxiredoxin
MSQLHENAKAPDFELPATTQEKIRLSEHLRQGPVLVLFYPLDWSPVCTTELCGLRDGLREYQSLGVQVLGVSVDSIFSHKAFAEKLGITFPLLSDFNKEVCRAYGAFHEEILGLRGIAKRSAFLIDRQGIIRYRWVSDDPGALPDFQAIKAACASL